MSQDIDIPEGIHLSHERVEEALVERDLAVVMVESASEGGHPCKAAGLKSQDTHLVLYLTEPVIRDVFLGDIMGCGLALEHRRIGKGALFGRRSLLPEHPVRRNPSPRMFIIDCEPVYCGRLVYYGAGLSGKLPRHSILEGVAKSHSLRLLYGTVKTDFPSPKLQRRIEGINTEDCTDLRRADTFCPLCEPACVIRRTND